MTASGLDMSKAFGEMQGDSFGEPLIRLAGEGEQA
jgi:hypothetical protein